MDQLGRCGLIGVTADRAVHPVTPDGRYFVVRGRLWRRSDPSLPDADREWMVGQLMAARRAVGVALLSGDAAALSVARTEVDRAKVALGERGAPWWRDGTPDLNRRMARNTDYAEWFAAIEETA